jgi:hypothetical protein
MSALRHIGCSSTRPQAVHIDECSSPPPLAHANTLVRSSPLRERYLIRGGNHRPRSTSSALLRSQHLNRLATRSRLSTAGRHQPRRPPPIHYSQGRRPMRYMGSSWHAQTRSRDASRALRRKPRSNRSLMHSKRTKQSAGPRVRSPSAKADISIAQGNTCSAQRGACSASPRFTD